MSASPFAFDRAPYRVRLGTYAILEDRDGRTVAGVAEPLNDPAERLRFAQALVVEINEAAARHAAENPALPQAAE
ncbi:hypothetical protein [Methylobacterium sp. V23]|uniref:hypothetical protein n=1 Tax=Methylobacterium sp. V23 TaxID=2044878 RepID=UPI000CDB2454|nr:hypothetical protein [Methylobacterium sp. V23]POR42531.1 hypothetical protein CRT23_12115 [Methylobacterium sp. V23]